MPIVKLTKWHEFGGLYTVEEDVANVIFSVGEEEIQVRLTYEKDKIEVRGSHRLIIGPQMFRIVHIGVANE